MKIKLFKDKRIIMVVFLCIITIVTVSLLLPQRTIVQASANNQCPREQLHIATYATTLRSEKPMITILTHGLGGSAGHWSNGMYRDGNGNWQGSGNGSFQFDSYSIIEQMRNHIPDGIRLFRAHFPSGVLNYSNFSLFEYTLNSITNPTAYVRSANIASVGITNFSQHMVVVIDSAGNNNKTNAQLYAELDYIIDRISYDFLFGVGILPRINLIGHSRGGLINMYYTISHPRNVVSLINIGTPHDGTWADNWFVENLFGVADFNTIGGQDITNPAFVEARRTAWNTMIAQNQHINFHAISATSSPQLLFHIVYNDGILEEQFSSTAALGLRTLYSLLSLTGFKAVMSLPGDVLVDYASQRANGYDGVIRFNKEFTSSNSNLWRRSRHHFPVPHNLQTYDAEIHNYIFSVVEFGSIFNTTNFGTISNPQIRIDRFNLLNLQSVCIPSQINGRTVTELGNSSFQGFRGYEVVIPPTVTYIGTNAFGNMRASIAIPHGTTSIPANLFANTGISTNIFIPSTVTHIGNNAFMNVFASIVLLEGRTHIQDGLFENTGISYITLPATITHIGSRAFYGVLLNWELSLLPNVEYIGYHAFSF